MIAIVDCNSFYCSCERVFYPKIWEAPVVVLSNNDGCIISRSDEAKALGVGMAAPYFQNREIIEKNNVSVFSSNYHLYGDMSRRVMDTLRSIVGEDHVEVYSVDEAFLDLGKISNTQLRSLGRHLKETVETWTGIKVSVGIAPSKTLAKAANWISKKYKQETKGVVVLDTPALITKAMHNIPVGELWGVGRKYADKLKRFNIHTAYDLSTRSTEWANTHLGGVVGMRLIKELLGEPVINMDKPLDTKKMIATTRMFGEPVNNLRDIKEAVATYTSRAAEKLRRQESAASVISVFVVPREPVAPGTRFRHGPMLSHYFTLPTATAITSELIKPAMQITEALFEEGRFYKKAGVTLSGLIPQSEVQQNLFSPAADKTMHKLMDMMDNVNFSMRDDVLKFASSGTSRDWKMRQEFRSPRHTTRWDELFEVR